MNPWSWSVETLLYGYRKPHEKRIYEIVMENLDHENPVSFLDVGFGAGIFLNFMSNYSSLAVGVELSSKFVKIVREHFKGINAEYIVADAERLPFRQESFDLILCNQVFEHLPNVEEAIHEIKRVTKHRGKVIASVPNLSEFAPVWVTLRQLGLDPVKMGKRVAKILRINPQEIEHNAQYHPQKKTPHEWQEILECSGFTVKKESIMTAPLGNILRIYKEKEIYRIVQLVDKTVGRHFPLNMLGSYLLLKCQKRDQRA